ncbi:probable plastid-lipid-associated protein 4, chloroplastic [Salvia miltiorrhiza]|uniref:probable plastid-lipid-associated protein 4, chloroplastic n=1 Tax=Salvia miltiorrhiza TaxID=226208 RepID=UPI0025AD312A|nr:probable plastid-lipid-associated protein 4, chloroplastic [Salvia miltiorrhiza]
MAILHLSPPPSLLHNSTDLYSTALFSPKRLLQFSSNQHSRRDASLHFPSYSSNRESDRWRIGVSFFAPFLDRSGEIESLKQQLLDAIAPLDRGSAATPEDQQLVDQIASKLEAKNRVKEPLKSSLLNGKWELLYTTSKSLLQSERPKIFRPNGKIYQAINLDTLRAQNIETWPFFNQATANLVPLNQTRVAVKFDSFKIAGVIPIKARGSGRGQLEITYLDEELRISRGNQGNLFILGMVDPFYRVPV